MNLLLRRDQRVSRLGKMLFVLDARAQLSKDEVRAIQTHRFGKAILYARNGRGKQAKSLPGLLSRLPLHAANISISVDDLANGKRIECRDILEMLAVQEQLKEAAANLKSLLEAARYFGGEEVIEL
jgi:hypothetical protein